MPKFPRVQTEFLKTGPNDSHPPIRTLAESVAIRIGVVSLSEEVTNSVKESVGKVEVTVSKSLTEADRLH